MESGYSKEETIALLSKELKCIGLHAISHVHLPKFGVDMSTKTLRDDTIDMCLPM
jgi:hypothetical protein